MGTVDEAKRPRPIPTAWSAGFWEASARGELVAQRCDGCEALRHYPQPMCPRCRSSEWGWQPLVGRGIVYSYTVSHRAFHPAWAEAAPYVIATIELEEGVRMVCDLDGVGEGVGEDDVAIGMPVEVFFQRLDEEIVLPRFRPRHSPRLTTR